VQNAVAACTLQGTAAGMSDEDAAILGGMVLNPSGTTPGGMPGSAGGGGRRNGGITNGWWRSTEINGAGTSPSGSSSNAAIALSRKLSALEDAQATASKVVTLPDGRIRYYESERLARTDGPSRGSSYVTEWNPSNGNVRSWNEVYDQAGNVNRVHPKMINGQTVNSNHYPPTAKDLGR
jgi:hypothetical protein